MIRFASPVELLDLADPHLGEASIEVTQEMVDLFAGATHDWQWIHVDPVAAAQGDFGGTIAHGYLTLSLVPQFLEQIFAVEGARASLNYGVNRVRFPFPVPVGTRLTARVGVQGAERVAGGVQAVYSVVIESPESPKPHCVAEVIVRYLEAVAEPSPEGDRHDQRNEG